MKTRGVIVLVGIGLAGVGAGLVGGTGAGLLMAGMLMVLDVWRTPAGAKK